MNKPFEVLCQFTDNAGRKTIADYIRVKDVYAAGRLDYDSEGLVVLTNVADMQHRIADPKYKLEKTYMVQVEGMIDEDALKRLSSGVLLKDGMTRPAKVSFIGEGFDVWPRKPPIRCRKNIPAVWIELTITEGRNRQVRRMTAAVGFPALRLVRTRVGAWSIGSLKPGEWREEPIPEDFL